MGIIVPRNPTVGTRVEVRYRANGLHLDETIIVPAYGRVPNTPPMRIVDSQAYTTSVLASFTGNYIGTHAGHLILEVGGRKIAIARSSIVEVVDA